MADPLRPEVLAPKSSGLARAIAVFTGFGAASIASLVVASVAVRTPSKAPTKPVVSSELLFVFRAGDATYVRLADLDPTEVPAHGRLRLVDDRSGAAAIGTVKDADTPAAYRGYRGKRLRVDGDCTAKIVDLAVVARLAGGTDHAPVDHDTWTANDVMKFGALTLAARIEGCAQGSYARDATLPEVVRPTKIVDPDLANTARSLVIASQPAALAQREWKAAALDGNWYDHVPLSISVMRHPITDVTWVTVHGIYSEVDCGGPNVNLWGLFRVGPDRKLETVDLRRLETLHSIDHVIDLEGDGELELVGKPWLGLETVLVKAAGEHEIDRLTVPFFGCGC